MPQMSPMSWLLMFSIFTLQFLMYNCLNYFSLNMALSLKIYLLKLKNFTSYIIYSHNILINSLTIKYTMN